MMDAGGGCLKTRAEPKASFNIVVTGKSSTIENTFNPPLYFDKERSYEVALLNLETYYAMPNIDKTNNHFKYSKDNGSRWTSVFIPEGCYEIGAINSSIIQIVGNKSITVRPNRNTLQSILKIADKYEVDFNVSGSLASVLGFNKKIYKTGEHTSEKIVDILRINSILVHTNIISGSYVSGQKKPLLFGFFPDVVPGGKIIQTPTNLVYIPVTLDVITSLQIWLTDQNNIQLNLRGERITVRLHLRER